MRLLSDLTGSNGVHRWAGYRYRTQEAQARRYPKNCRVSGIFYSLRKERLVLDIKTREESAFSKKQYLSLLNESLVAFKELLDLQYNITVARKGKKRFLNLVVFDRNFYHMVGLQHLNDVALVNEYPNIYRKIATDNLESQNIKSKLVESKHFSEIVGRLYALIYLRDNFYNAKDNKHYKFLSKEYGNYTAIEYDYIIQSEYKGIIYYYFLRHDEKSNDPNQCVVVSLFTKGIVDFTKGQAYMTLLEKVEFNKKTNQTKIIYKHNAIV